MSTSGRIRPDKLLHSWREPVVPQPAATILLLRDSARGPEVLMMRRSLSAGFAPGAYRFPGGVVDPLDASPLARAVSTARPDQPAELLAFATAAVRKAHEELGVLLARPERARPEPVRLERTGAERAHAERAGTERPGIDDLPALTAQLPRRPAARFYERLAELGLRLALDGVHWLSRWITERDLPERFDAHFFVARMPEGQEPTADEDAQSVPIWILPAEGLERHERGEFDNVFPTIRTLRALARHESVASLLDQCAERPGASVSCPRAGMLQGQVVRFSEDELPFGELELVTPDGRIAHALDWQHEHAVPLLRHVQRLTAPNPGRMTGPGTNTYIVGEPGDYIVIDPGPDDRGHIERITAIVGDGLQAIVCTHAHPDHAPGAAPLKRLTGAPILGRPTGPEFEKQWTFVPERTLGDGEQLRCADSTLRVLHTPGHVSNHICLLLEEDGLLFSGDHILSGSTTVISPPDGDMRDYVAQLRRLADEPFDFILPAHGYVIAGAKREVARLLAHRMARENKVLAALRAAGRPVTLDELVTSAYDDVDEALHPVAKRSLTAHLLKLRDDGIASFDGERWRAE